MAGERRVIFFSTQAERNQLTLESLRTAGFEIAVVSQLPHLMREVRNGRDRVLLLDFQSKDIDGLRLLREIKHLDGSVQILVINAAPKLFDAIHVFRSGGEACFFEPAPDSAELRLALDHAFDKIARWWRALQGLASARSGAEPAPAAASPSESPLRHVHRYPAVGEEIEVITRNGRLKGKTVSSSSAGMELVIASQEPPALFDRLAIHCRDFANQAVVRRMAKRASDGWVVGLEWTVATGDASVPVGAPAERALFVVLDGHHVVARSLVAVNKDWVSARLATGRMHSVPAGSVCALTKAEREAELLATDDLSFYVDFYQLESVMGLGAVVQAVTSIEFADEEAPA